MSDLPLIPEDTTNYTNEVLKNVSSGLLLASSVVAPNILSIFAKSLSPNKPDKTLRAIRYAKLQGWLTFEETDDGVRVALTESGQLKWRKIEVNSPLYEIRWDGKWRLVLFDIPNDKKKEADYFRGHLRKMGFKQLQQSAWITPYPCQTQVVYLRQLYEIKQYVRILEVLAIDDEQSLKLLFDL